MNLDRRNLLRFAIATTAIAASPTLVIEAVAAAQFAGPNKRKARYQANSAEVQRFYRVNRYPAE